MISVQGLIKTQRRLIKVRKVVSLLLGLDDRSGNSGDMFQHTKWVLVTTRKCTVAKNDPCTDVSQKYFGDLSDG